MRTIAYAKTPFGQFLYDLGFTDLEDRYLARKHRKPIAEIRQARLAVLKGLALGGDKYAAKKLRNLKPSDGMPNVHKDNYKDH